MTKKILAEMCSTIELFKVQHELSSVLLEVLENNNEIFNNRGSQYLTRELLNILINIENNDKIIANAYNSSFFSDIF